MHRVCTEQLSPAAFAPFGEIVAFDAGGASTVNDGWALRADTAARLEGDGASPILSIYRAEPRSLPLQHAMLEHHPHTSQAFVALTAGRFLVLVTPGGSDGLPDLSGARAFVGFAGQGVNYRRGVWHAPITALDQGGDFLMIMWERGIADDCIVHRMDTPLHVSSEPKP